MTGFTHSNFFFLSFLDYAFFCLLTWATAQVVTQTLCHVVQECVISQTCGFWLLSDALGFVFCMSIELEGVYNQSLSVVPPLQVGDFQV